MIVIVVETELYPVLVLGITEDDIVESEGVLPIIDLIQASQVTGIPDPPGAVQLIIGGTNEAIMRAVKASLPNSDFSLVARKGEPVADAIAEGRRLRAEHAVNTQPGRLN